VTKRLGPIFLIQFVCDLSKITQLDWFVKQKSIDNHNSLCTRWTNKSGRTDPSVFVFSVLIFCFESCATHRYCSSCVGEGAWQDLATWAWWQLYEGFSLYCLLWQCFDILLMGTSVLTLLSDLWGPVSQIIWGGPQPALVVQLIPIVIYYLFSLSQVLVLWTWNIVSSSFQTHPSPVFFSSFFCLWF